MTWPLLNNKSNNRLLACAIAVVFTAIVSTSCATGTLKEARIALPDDLPNIAEVQVNWWHVLGDEHSKKSFGQLQPTVFGEEVFTPLANGSVVKLNSTGGVIEQVDLAEGLTAPLAIDESNIAALNSDGELILLTHEFEKVWAYQLGTLSSSPAVLSEDRIFVHTIDGRISAIERITGRLLWVHQDAEPRLTLTGTSEPLLIETSSGQLLVTGLANGKLMALNVLDGSPAWEYRIARASGKTDVSRLVDVDAKVTELGEFIIATGYQGDFVVIEKETGKVVQAQKFSSYRSIVESNGVWYGVNDKSHVVAINPKTLEQKWVAESFEYRQLSELVVLADVIYVADNAGFLHLIDIESGEWLGSRHIDWRGSNSNPVIFNNGVLLQGYSSRLKHITAVRK